MVGNPERRNHNLYCQYHQDHGHTTEDCRSLWDHLDQLVREGRLRHLLHHSSGRGGQMNSESGRSDSTKPLLGTINVIFAAPGRTGSWPSKGSVVEIMYPDLYKGLNLKLDDLTPYCSSLVSFEGRIVTPKG
nr:hypothetical protein CFP56_29278 [Quercus suber]